MSIYSKKNKYINRLKKECKELEESLIEGHKTISWTEDPIESYKAYIVKDSYKTYQKKMKIIQEAENIVRLTRKGLCASIRVLLLLDKYLFQFINDSDSQTNSENEILKNNIAKLLDEQNFIPNVYKYNNIELFNTYSAYVINSSFSNLSTILTNISSIVNSSYNRNLDENFKTITKNTPGYSRSEIVVNVHNRFKNQIEFNFSPEIRSIYIPRINASSSELELYFNFELGEPSQHIKWAKPNINLNASSGISASMNYYQYLYSEVTGLYDIVIVYINMADITLKQLNYRKSVYLDMIKNSKKVYRDYLEINREETMSRIEEIKRELKLFNSLKSFKDDEY